MTPLNYRQPDTHNKTLLALGAYSKRGRFMVHFILKAETSQAKYIYSPANPLTFS